MLKILSSLGKSFRRTAIQILFQVVEYQAVAKVKKTADDDIMKIKPEPKEHDTRGTIISYPSVIQQASSSQSETSTMSQITIDHEEIASAQESTFEQPQEEPEDWLTTLTRRKQQYKWGREGIHEEDMLIITRDRIDTTPTNKVLISNIYGYYENNNPAIPTEIYYRCCKPATTAEELHRRENFRIRRREYFNRPRKIQKIQSGHGRKD